MCIKIAMDYHKVSLQVPDDIIPDHDTAFAKSILFPTAAVYVSLVPATIYSHPAVSMAYCETGLI